MNDEELLKQKMAEGYNIVIECKGKGRVYEMTFEGTAYRVGDPIFLGPPYHGVGNTLGELLNNMFDENKPLRKI